MAQPAAHLSDLVDFVGASPSSYHAAHEVARRAEDAGFVRVDESEPYSGDPGGYVLVRDGAVVAWRIPSGADATTGFRIVGAHTDSPTFKLKPVPELSSYGWQQVPVEVYGGPLVNSWLDRDLGLAGRLVDRDGGTHLVRTGAVMRIPQLAIHLDRAVNDGLVLNRQTHLQPVWGIDGGDVLERLASAAGLSAGDVAGHDVVAFDTQRGAVFGGREEFLACGRLDNLSSVHAGLAALLASDGGPQVEVLIAFDHEEVGSETRSGASGPILPDVLQAITTALGGGTDELRRALAVSSCVSADAGHAVHPNYPERHDPTHRPLPGAGPLLKINANQRYASDGVGIAMWRQACAAADVPVQEFVSNNAVPCGSTIGPLTATRLGLTTVDVGIALLSMHSAREMCGVTDPGQLTDALTAYLSGS
ncbi:M18 family aminopeptidase [Epidermidibacterium keratini]|uniref:M18 family aminopeptidase n=1 Tax=Epidermidibacterium keratini TaxID=1891644 RepID=A0A7L4YLY6_9ACTN|nr:M18 family aminopeptidase [Epidermidibacterium keratini]QHB99838.1 M18 family aminopeptidase [Epidermidibacterium keratini]